MRLQTVLVILALAGCQEPAPAVEPLAPTCLEQPTLGAHAGPAPDPGLAIADGFHLDRTYALTVHGKPGGGLTSYSFKVPEGLEYSGDLEASLVAEDPQAVTAWGVLAFDEDHFESGGILEQAWIEGRAAPREVPPTREPTFGFFSGSAGDQRYLLLVAETTRPMDVSVFFRLHGDETAPETARRLQDLGDATALCPLATGTGFHLGGYYDNGDVLERSADYVLSPEPFGGVPLAGLPLEGWRLQAEHHFDGPSWFYTYGRVGRSGNWSLALDVGGVVMDRSSQYVQQAGVALAGEPAAYAVLHSGDGDFVLDLAFEAIPEAGAGAIEFLSYGYGNTPESMFGITADEAVLDDPGPCCASSRTFSAVLGVLGGPAEGRQRAGSDFA